MTPCPPRHVLGIDTCSAELKLGLRFGTDRLLQVRETVGRSHGEVIMKKIAGLFQSAGIERTDLEAIVACTGPGSFTGLRIGLAAAKGMAVALKIPVVGVNLFEVIAYKLRHLESTIRVVVPLNRDECFLATVSQGKFVQNSIKVIPYAKLEASVGDSAVAGLDAGFEPTWRKSVDQHVLHSVDYEASDLIHIGLLKLVEGYDIPLADLEPLYVQKSQAEIRFEQRQKKR